VFNDLETGGATTSDCRHRRPHWQVLGAGERLASHAPLQTCVAHLIRNSLAYAGWKERRALAEALKPIYTAATAESAQAQLDAFDARPWGKRFPPEASAWRRASAQVIPLFAYPPDLKRVIYTTNGIERSNAQLRKSLKTRVHFPSDDAANKLICLALRKITVSWGLPAKARKAVMNQFAILYGDRLLLQPTA
jgi:putative transposase